jgi:hypothetical protein
VRQASIHMPLSACSPEASSGRSFPEVPARSSSYPPIIHEVPWNSRRRLGDRRDVNRRGCSSADSEVESGGLPSWEPGLRLGVLASLAAAACQSGGAPDSEARAPAARHKRPKFELGRDLAQSSSCHCGSGDSDGATGASDPGDPGPAGPGGPPRAGRAGLGLGLTGPDRGGPRGPGT